MGFLVVLFFFGLATGVVGKIKGSSFFVWFLIGFCLPVMGLIAAILYRWERDEPRRPLPALRHGAPDRGPGLHGVRRGHGLAGARGRRAPAARADGPARRESRQSQKPGGTLASHRAGRGNLAASGSFAPICGAFPVLANNVASGPIVSRKGGSQCEQSTRSWNV